MKKVRIFISMLALAGWSNFSNAQQAGTIDPSFIPASGLETTVTASALQADGKIITGGNFSKGIERLNTDGSIDNMFSVGTGTDATVLAIALQNDGKIIIGGCFNSYNGTNTGKIARLNPDGTLDPTFMAGTGILQTGAWAFGNFPAAAIHSIALQPDGKIIIGGSFDFYNGTAIYNLARLNANGTLDTTLIAEKLGAHGTVWSLAIQNDNKIIIGVGFYSTRCGSYSGNVIRLNTCGAVDSTFKGYVCGSLVKAIALQNDGKIIIGGNFWGYHNDIVQTYTDGIVRLNTDGKRDASFLLNQIETTYSIDVNTIVIQNDGKILVGAGTPVSYSNGAANLIFRLNNNGTVDNTFNRGEGTTGAIDIYTISLQSDGKIIIGGNFTTYDEISGNGILRLNGSELLSGEHSLSAEKEEAFIFPNPSSGTFNLELPENMEGAIISITDVFGKEIYYSTVDTQQTLLNMDITNQPAGAYTIHVILKDRQYRNKMIVQK